MRMVLLAAIAAVVFEVFVLVFVASAERSTVRTMPKWVWILLCVVFPVLGGIAYLVFGRPIAGELGYSAANDTQSSRSARQSNQPDIKQLFKDFLGIEADQTQNLPAEFKYRPEPTARKGPLAPDDDPDFLKDLDRRLKEQKNDSDKAQDLTAPNANDDPLGEEPGVE